MTFPTQPPVAELEPARRAVSQAIAEGCFPGAQVLVARRSVILWHEAFGHAALEPVAARMDESTLIDVASLTKALVTATVAALLVSRGIISLDMPLSRLLPEARGTDKATLTVRQLLAHEAGFPLYVPYFRRIIGRYAEFRRLPFVELKREIIRLVLQERLQWPPGTKQQYSDLDYILLGEALGRIAGSDLAHFFRIAVVRPFGLTACFRPLPAENIVGSAFAASERCPWRGEVLQGLVHDDHAYLMGGVAGHAGLFATASDVYTLVRAWHDAYRGVPVGEPGSWIMPDVARTFWRRASVGDENTWMLGWDTPTPGQSTSGRFFSSHSAGHLGFTGSSVWFDIDREIAVVLLTNRIHPLRSNLAVKQFRPLFHDLVMEPLLDGLA